MPEPTKDRHKLSKREKISWSVPRWSYWDRKKRSYAAQLRDISWLRVAAASYVACYLIVLFFQWQVPGLGVALNLNAFFLWQLPLILFGIGCYMAVMLGFQLVIKPQIQVRTDRVHYSHGQSAFIIKATDLRKSRITIFAPERKQLVLWYDRKGKRRLLRVGIDGKVELDRLCELLPVKPTIRDARADYQRLFPRIPRI